MEQTATDRRQAVADWVRQRGDSYADERSLAYAASTWAAARGHSASDVWGALLATGHTLAVIRERRRIWASASSQVTAGVPSSSDERLRVARRLVGHLLTEIGTDSDEKPRAVDTALLRRAFAVVALEALANAAHADRPGVAIGGKELALRVGVSPVTGQRLLRQMQAAGWLRPFKKLGHGGQVWKLGRLGPAARAMAEDQQSDLVDALAYDGEHPAADVIRTAGHLGWDGAPGRSVFVLALADSLGWRRPPRSRRPEHRELEVLATAMGARPAPPARKAAESWLANVMTDGSLAAGLDRVVAADPSLAEKASARRAVREAELAADRERRALAGSRAAVTKAARKQIRDAGGPTWELSPENAGGWLSRLREDGQWAGIPEIVRARAAELIADDLRQAGLEGGVAVARAAGVAYLSAWPVAADVRLFAAAVADAWPDGGAELGRAVRVELLLAGRADDEATRIGMRLAGLEDYAGAA